LTLVSSASLLMPISVPATAAVLLLPLGAPEQAAAPSSSERRIALRCIGLPSGES
jgi:hypothetical protein